MKAISYRMTDDIGHAPCAFDSVENLTNATSHNFWKKSSDLLTLSCCGQNVRRMATPGDFVLGIAGNPFGKKRNNLIWIGKLDKILDKRDYSKRYQGRPDNYYHEENGELIMEENAFHDATNIDVDLNPDNTLLFREFFYFGKNVVHVPKHLISKNYPIYVSYEQTEHYFKRLKEDKHHYGVFGIPNDLERNREALKDWV